ncbi:hypothetical protein ACFS33_03550 [Cellulomonas phragmiteti]
MTPEDPMCYPTACPTCGLTTWAGCGEHVDAVRAQVPDAQWCTCDREAST